MLSGKKSPVCYPQTSAITVTLPLPKYGGPEVQNAKTKYITADASWQKALEDKWMQIERLDTVKKMNAAKARLQVYTQEVDSDQEISQLLDEPRQRKPASKSRDFTVHHKSQTSAPVQPVLKAYKLC